MIIGDKNTENKVLIIAEIGNNHEGNFTIAKQLVEAAASCGVDAVKFQTYKTEKFISPSEKDRFKRLKSFELSYSQFKELSELAHKLGLLFISTPLDLESASFLNSIVDMYKIASGDNNFYPLLESVAKTGKPIILSTGASDSIQITQAISCLESIWDEYQIRGDLALLHCVSCYPAPPGQINLAVIQKMSETYNYPVGYSDHTIGIDAAVFSVALGAEIIEKHFTLDKEFSSFRDHQLSADPHEMSLLVSKIRELSVMKGSKEKAIQQCEIENQVSIRRSIVAANNMKSGHIISYSDLLWLRPGTGLAPGNEKKVVGKRMKHSIKSGEQIFENDVQ